MPHWLGMEFLVTRLLARNHGRTALVTDWGKGWFDINLEPRHQEPLAVRGHVPGHTRRRAPGVPRLALFP